MKVSKMPWKQQNVNLDSVILVEKMSSKSRIDLEEITVDGSEDYISWKYSYKLFGLYEVYSDEVSFSNRAIPIDLVKYYIEKSCEDVDNQNISDLLLNNLHNHKLENQDFSKGEVVII